MLNCRDVTERVTDYLERDLSWWERLWFRLHLAMCAACRRYVAQMRTTTQLLRQLGERPADPPAVDPAIREAFRAGRQSAPPR
ncbi:MAG: zf-HC2 domain-containing protein [Acidobacteriota bacterium]